MRIQALRWAAFWLGVAPSALATAGGLDDYVKRPDPTFAWKVTGEDATEAGRVVHLDLTSQTWKGIAWKHQLRVYEPKAVKYPDAMLLFITGGNTESQPKADDHQFGFALANLCGGRVAVLPQVPNQPLLGGKSEDTLIAETFVRYLETRDADWPLLLPMVKSAVRSMDAVQAWAKGAGRPEVTKFVVAGASKRGWTTWLTGAVDPRVAGIAPMVIVTLNMKAQNANQLAVWGRNSEQIDDYTSRGLTDHFDAPERKALWELVDPYFYLNRLTMPKLLINGTNDRYWTLNALDLYWDDIQGPKNVVYLPNAGHGLDQHRDYALNGLGAFFRHVVTARPMPQVSWGISRVVNGPTGLTVTSPTAPKLAKLWSARAEKADFRDSRWESTPMAAGTTMTAEIPTPEKGRVAFFADLEYEIDGLTFHLSTKIGQRAANGHDPENGRTTP
jgi:PhoPQ-activated pathogenicity-related protein